jgi:hypothetical protein
MKNENNEQNKQPEKPKGKSSVDPHKKHPAMSFVEFTNYRFTRVL